MMNATTTQKLNVNVAETLKNIREKKNDSTSLLNEMIAIFEENGLDNAQRLAVCTETLIGLEERIHFNDIVRQMRERTLQVFGYSSSVPIVEKIMLDYLAKNLTISI